MSTSYSKKHNIFAVCKVLLLGNLQKLPILGGWFWMGWEKCWGWQRALGCTGCPVDKAVSWLPEFWQMHTVEIPLWFFSFLFLDYSIIEIVHWLIAHVSVASKYTFQRITTFCFFLFFVYHFCVATCAWPCIVYAPWYNRNGWPGVKRQVTYRVV